MGRRDSSDEKWQMVKRIVHKIDEEQCCCCRILNLHELKTFMQSNSMYGSRKVLQCAHRAPVSVHLDVCYDVNNVFLLCADHHGRIDHFEDPVTGEDLTEEQHEAWWDRIATPALERRRLKYGIGRNGGSNP